MSTPSHPSPVRCHHCGDVIGVYEPLVVMTETGTRETSLAAEPDLTGVPSPVYHCACSDHAAKG